MSDNFDEHDWKRFLKSLGEDPDRPGLVETPARVTKAWKHWSSGYGQNPADVLKAFEECQSKLDYYTDLWLTASEELENCPEI